MFHEAAQSDIKRLTYLYNKETQEVSLRAGLE